MLVYKVFFIYCILNIITADGPTVDDLVKAQQECTHMRPNFCVKYGKCCSGDEFCHEATCASCFPADVSEIDLLAWCKDKGQHSVTLMRHWSCRLACQFRFNVSELSQCEESPQSTWMIPFIVTIVIFGCENILICMYAIRKKLGLSKCGRQRNAELGDACESEHNEAAANLLNTNSETIPVSNNLMRSLSQERDTSIRLQTLASTDNIVNADDVTIHEDVVERGTTSTQQLAV